jgi:hypothetical protein
VKIALGAVPDPALLVWAAANERVLLTHDRRTMPGHAGDLLAAGQPLAGVIIVPRRLSLQQAIDELEIIVACSETAEWAGLVRYLPL